MCSDLDSELQAVHSKEFLDFFFRLVYLECGDKKSLYKLPSWVDLGASPLVSLSPSELSLAYDDYRCEYVPGEEDNYYYGDILTIDGVDYRYASSIPLPEHVEHYTIDDLMVLEYRGPSFLRILYPTELTPEG